MSVRSLVASITCVLVCTAASAQHLTPQSNYGESTGTFPNWQERAVLELTNRARVEPATELAACPAGRCTEAACYSAMTPVAWNYDLNQSARFHSDAMGHFPFFAHDTPCVLFSDIDARYPGSSNGSFASSCSSSGATAWSARITKFGAAAGGENIAAGQGTPFNVFYGWLYETTTDSSCGFHLSGDNGHRVNILTNGPDLGVGYALVPGAPYGVYWTQDFGGSIAPPKIPSGSHWTSVNHARDPVAGDNAVEFWANWYDSAGPSQATVVVDNVPAVMTRSRGTAANGAWLATVSGLSASCHQYYFSFVDSSLQTVRYPTTGTLGMGSGCADWQASVVAPAAPTGVNAVATSPTQVQVTWNAATGATSYDIYRRGPGTGFVKTGSSLTTSFTDTTVANYAYLYQVRAINAGGFADSASDLATTVMFTNDPLTPGMMIQPTVVMQLRTAVNAVRALAGLPDATFTDGSLSGVRMKPIHVSELRTYLDQALAALAIPGQAYTDTPGPTVPIKAIHFQEIRNRVK